MSNDHASRFGGVLPFSTAFLSGCATGLFESGHLEANPFSVRYVPSGIGIGHFPAMARHVVP
jgi:hypothetical protein